MKEIEHGGGESAYDAHEGWATDVYLTHKYTAVNDFGPVVRFISKE